MTKKWIPRIDRKPNTNLSEKHLKFFHRLLTAVENDDSPIEVADWKKLNCLKSKLTIESETKNVKIQIPPKIEFGSIYSKVCKSKSRNFLKDLRNAFAHNYIVVDVQDGQDIIKIALPTKNKKGIKFACYVSFEDLKTVISIITKSKLTQSIK
ncbi:MAG: hypothetical protein HDR45_06990 [Bacteroides sp.]|nr:hypothetical protein [Bacteroides sp.]